MNRPEVTLDVVSIESMVLRPVVRIVLHTIMYHRAFGDVRIRPVKCEVTGIYHPYVK